MAPKVFITGATGYIGGDALFEISRTHPDWQVVCMVRDHDKGAKIMQQYPSIRLVHSDLESFDIIEEEASKADVVYHFANCDHEASAKAIAAGLARRKDGSAGYWIHTSGALILGTKTIDGGRWGDELPHIYDDWHNIAELTSFPDHAEHRNVDKIVLAASEAHQNKVQTAIVCPPAIYGTGRGPVNQRSKQINMVAEAYMKHQKAFSVGKGENIWHGIHIRDLSRLYVLLGEAAANGGSPATWGKEGYYLVESGSFVFKDVLRAVAESVQKLGYGAFNGVTEIPPEDAGALMRGAKYLIGTNSRGRALRARELLGWKPQETSLMDEIPNIVQDEAERLGLGQKL
ncbi:hypothetical protein H2200_009091 [Cladophialophora chaetospira]|uniref:NmrA-like domain-containing protein n=1 Tax=Cladophialophora chaetospira TaxID=386627 RepID=A0AA39CFD7_9EURO|nr:hypothetical protein H2200_009091 [Cladophialophora chaetospira]